MPNQQSIAKRVERTAGLILQALNKIKCTSASETRALRLPWYKKAYLDIPTSLFRVSVTIKKKLETRTKSWNSSI